jgi:hypothetical protein
LNKLESKVLCIIDIPSIRHALSIPESSLVVSEPFEEEKLIKVYKECPLEVKILFLQTIVKPEYHYESMSLPMNISFMIIEVQWACSILSQILGLDNNKFVVEAMLGFLLIFFSQILVSQPVSALKISSPIMYTISWKISNH